MQVDPLLQLLSQKARYTHKEIADILKIEESAVSEQVGAWEEDGTSLGYHAVINGEQAGNTNVSAFIEVKLTPERCGGFDRLAMRIAKFDQVEACYLASGGYDLLVIVQGPSLREVARFVSEKLSTIDGVLSTATHFKLKAYKEHGFIFEQEDPEGRLVVSP